MHPPAIANGVNPPFPREILYSTLSHGRTLLHPPPDLGRRPERIPRFFWVLLIAHPAPCHPPSPRHLSWQLDTRTWGC